jgi:hypothetical protein
MNEEKLLKKKKVAEMLDCSTRAVDRLAAAGRLTRIKNAVGVRFLWSEVLMLMKGGHHDFHG